MKRGFGQTAQYQPAHCNLRLRRAAHRRHPVIRDQPPLPTQLSKLPLHHPAARQHRKTALPRLARHYRNGPKGYITCFLAGVIRETYALPDRIIGAMTKPGDASAVPRRLRGILTAVAAEPNPPAGAEVLAHIAAARCGHPLSPAGLLTLCLRASIVRGGSNSLCPQLYPCGRPDAAAGGAV